MALSLSGVMLPDLNIGSDGSGEALLEDLKETSLSLSELESLISCFMSCEAESWDKMKSMPKLSRLLELVDRSMIDLLLG